MPTYEYACKECDEHVEAHQSFDDPPLTECPACKGPLRKVFGNIAITFKGSGFYKTDSRKPEGNGKTKGDKAATPASSETAKASAEASPATSSSGDASPAKSSSKDSSSPSAAAAS